MVRYLKESDVRQLLTMPLAPEQVERAVKHRALARAADAAVRGVGIDLPIGN